MQTAASRKPYGERTRSLARKTKQKITFLLKAGCSDLLQKKGERIISSETLGAHPMDGTVYHCVLSECSGDGHAGRQSLFSRSEPGFRRDCAYALNWLRY